SPTVILVHGAFADASSWAPVLRQLLDAGIVGEAIPNPLRGLTFDGEYVASVLGQIDGPIVLVGHSYGGAVMTYASPNPPNVRAVVYVASCGLDRGVSANQSVADYPPPELASSVEVRTFPNGDEPGLEALIEQERFHSAFCADLPVEEADVYGAGQRPVAVAALDEPLGVEPGGRSRWAWSRAGGRSRAGSSSPARITRSTRTPNVRRPHAWARRPSRSTAARTRSRSPSRRGWPWWCSLPSKPSPAKRWASS